MDASVNQVALQVEGMTCASCVSRVEKALLKVPGVSSASVNLATEKATVRALSTVSPAALQAAIEKAGYVAIEVDETGTAAPSRLPSWCTVAASTALTLP